MNDHCFKMFHSVLALKHYTGEKERHKHSNFRKGNFKLALILWHVESNF